MQNPNEWRQSLNFYIWKHIWRGPQWSRTYIILKINHTSHGYHRPITNKCTKKIKIKEIFEEDPNGQEQTSLRKLIILYMAIIGLYTTKCSKNKSTCDIMQMNYKFDINWKGE
jgi:hypothetical protein